MILKSHSSYHGTNGNIFTSQGSQHGICFAKWIAIKNMFSLLSLHCSYLAFTLLALHFTLNVRILGEVQPAELIDRGEKSEFFKSPKKISKNDVSSVQENSKNVANAPTASDIEYRIFWSTVFPEVVGTYLQREMSFTHTLAALWVYRLAIPFR